MFGCVESPGLEYLPKQLFPFIAKVLNIGYYFGQFWKGMPIAQIVDRCLYPAWCGSALPTNYRCQPTLCIQCDLNPGTRVDRHAYTVVKDIGGGWLIIKVEDVLQVFLTDAAIREFSVRHLVMPRCPSKADGWVKGAQIVQKQAPDSS